jgi:PHP family Zn ribbon phosphoesterase
MKVITVNHGNVFGTGKWFTFYCGKCERQLTAGDKKCNHCGEEALYEGAKNTEQQKSEE